MTSKDLARGGANHQSNTYLNASALAIEITNWGGLTQKGQGFYSYAGVLIPNKQITEYDTPFRGYTHYQSYTTAQLDSLEQLITFLADKYSITPKYIGQQIFDICPDALQGNLSLFTHTSVRIDKQDCHPQPELIELLKSL